MEPLKLEELVKYTGQKVLVKLADENDSIHWNADLINDTKLDDPWTLDTRPEHFMDEYTSIVLHPPKGCARFSWCIPKYHITNNKILIYPFSFLTILSNKGRIKCFKCGCSTEQRRDFNDFSIREFCPRCKL